MFYLHRFIRLTPLFGASILFSMSLLRFLGSGPFLPTMLHFSHGECERYWWSTLLFIQNFVNQNDMASSFSYESPLNTNLLTLHFNLIKNNNLNIILVVFSTHMVDIARYAALLACTRRHLFDSSIQSESAVRFFRTSSLLHWLHIDGAFEIRIENHARIPFLFFGVENNCEQSLMLKIFSIGFLKANWKKYTTPFIFAIRHGWLV